MAVTVFVVVENTRVAEIRVFVMILVEVVVTALGVTVLVLLAVALGTVTVAKGPTSVTSTDVVLTT